MTLNHRSIPGDIHDAYAISLCATRGFVHVRQDVEKSRLSPMGRQQVFSTPLHQVCHPFFELNCPLAPSRRRLPR